MEEITDSLFRFIRSNADHRGPENRCYVIHDEADPGGLWHVFQGPVFNSDYVAVNKYLATFDKMNDAVRYCDGHYL